MRFKRNITWLLLIVILVCSVSACGKKNAADEAGTGANQEETAASSSEEIEDTKQEAGEIEIPAFDKNTFPAIDGSTATIPLGQLMYRMSTGASELDAATDIHFSKTTESYLKLISGDVDLVIAYEAGEKAKENPGYQDLIIEPIGLDALVFLCNQSNPVNDLSAEAIKGIYTGKYTNWKDVGGEDHNIIPYQRPLNSGSQTLMNKLFVKESEIMDAPTELTLGEMGDLIDGIAKYDNSADAMGYSVYYYAANMYQDPNVKMISVDGVKPDSDTIRSGKYPYVNPFYVAIRKDMPEDDPATILFHWLTDTDGQSLVNALGYVGVKDSAKKLPDAYKISNVSIDIGDDKLVFSAESYNGNAGIVIFDRHLKPEKYLTDIGIYNGDDCTLARNNLMLARNTKIKDSDSNVGLYDIEKEEWVIEPEYEGAQRLFENGKIIKYYLTNYDMTDFTMTNTIVVSADGKISNEYIDEETYYDAYRSSEPSNYSVDYMDDGSDFYLADRVVVQEKEDKNGKRSAQLSIAGKIVEKSGYVEIIPISGMGYRADELPIGYYAIRMYDIVDFENYILENDRFVLINKKGDAVYTANIFPDSWLVMATEDYYIVRNVNGQYKILTPKGELITGWEYSDYDDTAYDEYYYDDYSSEGNYGAGDVVNNGNYFVKVGDRVYFREYGKRALENPTIFGKYLLTPTGDSSHIDYYDESIGQTVQAFEDFGFGNIAYMDGHFFLNGLDFGVSDYGTPYIYAVDEDGAEYELPEIYHGTIKGVSPYNDMLFYENTYAGNEYQPIFAGITSDGQKAFEVKSDNLLTYLGASDEYVLYAEIFYGVGEMPRAIIWSRNIYSGETVKIDEITCTEGDSIDFGEIFAFGGMYYLPIVERAGSGSMFQNGILLSYLPSIESSGEVAAEFYADENNDEPLVYVNGVERHFGDHDTDTYYIEMNSFEAGGDLYKRQKNGRTELEIEKLIPGAGYYETRKDMTLAESVDGTGYIMLATEIYDEEGSIGWRDGFRLLKMEYLKLNGDGTYDVIQTVQYE